MKKVIEIYQGKGKGQGHRYPNMIFWLLWLFISRRGRKKKEKKKKKSDVCFLTLFCEPGLWGYQKHGIIMEFKFSEYI